MAAANRLRGPGRSIGLALCFAAGLSRLHGLDCDGDGVHDAVAIAHGWVEDCDRDGVPDACALLFPLELRARLALSLGFKPLALAAGDFDGDGRAEAIVLDTALNTRVEILDFGKRRRTPLEFSSTVLNAAAADFDGDGAGDLAVLESGRWQTLSILFGDGSGGFPDRAAVSVDAPLIWGARPVSSPLLPFDPDGDGDLDLAFSLRDRPQAVVVIANRGARRMAVHPGELTHAGGLPPRLQSADLDLDGRDELIVGNGADGLEIFHWEDDGDARKELLASPIAVRDSAVADFDGDGDADVVIAGAGWGNHPRLFLNSGAQGFEPAPPPPFDVELAVQRVVAAELDGDGDEDLVFLGSHPGLESRLRAVVFLNNGRGSFEQWDAIAPEFSPAAWESLVVADVDGDRRLDLIVPDFAGLGIAVLENRAAPERDCDGDGALDRCQRDGDANGVADACELAAGVAADCDGDGAIDSAELRPALMPRSPQRVPWRAYEAPTSGCALGDFDGDGDADVATAFFDGPPRGATAVVGFTLGILWNEGADGWLRGPSIELPARVDLLRAGDLDGDGDLDLALAFADGGLSIAWNRGGRAFDPLGEPSPGSALFELADLDGDGDLDVACASVILKNRGAGVFEEMPAPNDGRAKSLAAGDLDQDGDLDLAYGGIREGGSRNRVRLCFNDGDGRFSTTADLEAAFSPRAIALHDLDGDGDGDLVGADPGVQVLRNAGGGVFAESSEYLDGAKIAAFAVGDLDGDGDLDLAAARGVSGPSNESSMEILSNPGDGRFGDPTRLGLRQPADGLHLADLDGDGLVDLFAAVRADRQWVAIRNYGRGRFGAATERHAFGASVISAAVADLDGDGAVDGGFILGTDSRWPVALLWGLAEAAPAGDIEVSTLDAPRAIAAADLDRDGLLEIVVAIRSGLLVLRQAAPRRFQPGARLATSSPPLALLVQDFEGDLDLDLLTLNPAEGIESGASVSVFLQGAPGEFAAARNRFAGRSAQAFAAADFDGDLDLDLAVASNGAIRWLRQDRAALVDAGETRTEGPLAGVVAGDFDGDGDADLAARAARENGLFLLENRGGFAFSTSPMVALSLGLGPIGTADLDGDGRLDLAALNVAAGTLDVLIQGDGGFRRARTLDVGRAPAVFAIADVDKDGDQDFVLGHGGPGPGDDYVAILEVDLSPPAEEDRDQDGVPDACARDRPFRRGDVNQDGSVDMGDAMRALGFLFFDASPPRCLRAADANADGALNLADPIRLLGALFLGLPELPAPSAGCGVDAGEDGLGCEDFGACGRP